MKWACVLIANENSMSLCLRRIFLPTWASSYEMKYHREIFVYNDTDSRCQKCINNISVDRPLTNRTRLPNCPSCAIWTKKFIQSKLDRIHILYAHAESSSFALFLSPSLPLFHSFSEQWDLIVFDWTNFVDRTLTEHQIQSIKSTH